MTTPHVRDPKPLADSLIRFTGDDPTPMSLLANGLRAALHECAEQQVLAVGMLENAEGAFRSGLFSGWLETANKVVRRVEEALERLPEAKDETVRMADVEAWLTYRRDECAPTREDRQVLDLALDNLREHFQTGTPLDEAVQR